MTKNNGKKLIDSIVIVLMVVIALVIGALIVSSVLNISTSNCTPSDSSSSTQSILTESTATLTPVGEGISSFTSATANNDSWMGFDGVNDEIRIPNSITNINLTDLTNFSLSVWVKVKEIPQSSFTCGIITSHFKNGISLTDTGKVVYGLRNSTFSGNVDTSAGTLKNQTWQLITGTYNSTNKNYSLYIDNEIDGSDIFTVENVILDEIWGIGGDEVLGGNRAFCKTSFDEVRIYNQTLTQTQISEIYNSGRIANASLPSDGLVLWYSFNEGTGTTVYDKSGNGNNGE